MRYTLQQLSDMEEIRQLKYRYWRCIDTANWAEIESVFAEDVAIDYRGGSYRVQVKGRAEMVEFLASSFNAQVVAMHHGHSPEIEFTGPDSAKAIWYLQDRFINPARRDDTQGTALYYDRYVRTGDGWKLAFSEYERVWETVTPIPADVGLSHHLLAERGRPPEACSDLSKWIIWYQEGESG